MMRVLCAQVGSLSVEFLIALTLMTGVLTLSARIVFNLQDIVVTKELVLEAQELAEADSALVRIFSGAIQNIPAAIPASATFTMQRMMQYSTLCSSLATDRVLWNVPKQGQIELSTMVTSLQSVEESGLDCPTVGLSGAWSTPRIVGNSVLGLSRIQVHGVDVVNRGNVRIAVVVGTSTQIADPDLFIIDVTDPAVPILLSSLHSGNGLFAVDVAGSHAYLVQNSNTLQLQVVSISTPSYPILVASRSLPSASGSFPEGRSVFVFRNRVYIGTYETAGSEFYVFDISNPVAPVFLGSKAVNHSVRQIAVREEIVNGTPKLLAYIASSANNTELQVLDVTDPVHILDFSSFDAQGGGSGTALFPAGTMLWLARQQVAGEPTIAAVSVSNPHSPALISTFDLKLKSGSVVNGLTYSNAILVLTTTDIAAPLLFCEVGENYLVSRCSKFTFLSSPGRVDYQDNLLFIPSGNKLLIVGS